MYAARSLMSVVAAAGLLVSCGDDNRRALDFGSTGPSTSLVATSLVATSLGSTSPVSTDAAPVTVPTAQDLAGAGFLAALGVRERCDYDPAGCDFGAIAVPDSEMDRTTRATVKMHLEGNLRAVPGNGGVLVRVESVSANAEVAFVVSCIYDTEVVFDVGRSPKAFDDIVFNDFKQSDRTRWELRSDHGRWLIVQGISIESLNGGDLCQF